MPQPEYRPDQPSLIGPRLRLERAKQRLDCFDAKVLAYLDTHPYRIPDKPEVDGDWKAVVIRIDPPPDPKLGIIVSEAVHHLRAALDNLVWQLVLVNDREPTPDNQFPIYTNPAKPPSKARLNTLLGGIHEEHRAFIEELQPYKGRHIHRVPRLALATLVELSNIDKHRYLQPAFGMAHQTEKPEFIPDDPSTVIYIEHFFGWVYDGTPLVRIRTVPP